MREQKHLRVTHMRATAKKTDKAAPKAHKRFNLKKLSYNERKNKSTAKKTEKAAPKAHKRYNLKKLLYDERENKMIERLNALGRSQYFQTCTYTLRKKKLMERLNGLSSAAKKIEKEAPKAHKRHHELRNMLIGRITSLKCKYSLQRLEYVERKNKLIGRLDALKSAAGEDDDEDGGEDEE